MSSGFWVMGCDPGLTTGVALIRVAPDSSSRIELMGQRTPEEVSATLHKAREYRTGQLGVMYLAYETFRGAGPRTRESTLTQEIVGYLKYSAGDFGFLPVPQTNQSRLAFVQAAKRLTEEQFPDSEFRVHELDALAHCLRCRDTVFKENKCQS
jgi:hypothetical protein